jgi:hypothetical protein
LGSSSLWFMERKSRWIKVPSSPSTLV